MEREREKYDSIKKDEHSKRKGKIGERKKESERENDDSLKK